MNAGQTVLIADAGVEVAKIISENLTDLGLRVVIARNSIETLDSARRFRPALVILELVMPDLPGTEVLRQLKNDPMTAKSLILVLTESNLEVDRIVSFELGADDYVTKPFSMRELALRTRALLARQGISPATRYVEIGAISLDREGREIAVGGKRISLTAREYLLMQALFSYPGKVFSRDELISMAWSSDTTINSRTIDTHFRRLRVRLGHAARQIHTVRGFGYRLDSE